MRKCYAGTNTLLEHLELFMDAVDNVGVETNEGLQAIPLSTYQAFFETKTAPFPRRFVMADKMCRIELERASPNARVRVNKRNSLVGDHFKALAWITFILQYKEKSHKIIIKQQVAILPDDSAIFTPTKLEA